MSTLEQLPTSRRSIIVAALAIVCVGLVIRFGMLVTLYDGDMELFVYMGKLAGQGGRIGIELIDNKLPTVSLVMWPLYWVFGAWWAGYALFSIAGACVAAWAITRAAGRVYPSSQWPTLAIAATWMSFPIAVFCAFKLEHLCLPAVALAAYFFVRCRQRLWLWDAFLVGLLAGVGALAKPNALAVLAAAGVSLACWRGVTLSVRVRVALAMLGGVAVPAVAALLYLIGSGAIAALPDVYRQIRLYNGNSIWQTDMVVYKAIFVAFLLGAPLAMRAWAERRGREPARDDGLELAVFAGLWLAIEIVGVAAQGRMYGYHFLPLAAPAALLFGLIPRRAHAVAIVGSCAPVLLFTGYWFWFATAATKVPVDRLAAIDFVKTHAAAGDGVWMDEYARLLVESDLKAGSRVPLTFIFSNDDDAPRRFGGMILTDLRDRRPRWVVLPADPIGHAQDLAKLRIEYVVRPTRGVGFVAAWTRIDRYVESNYAPAATFGNLRVFERKAAVQTVSVDAQ